MPHADIVLTDNFPILSLTLVTEPLRVANRETADTLWRWRFLSVKGGHLTSSSGIDINTDQLDHSPADVVLLLSSYHPETAVAGPLLGWLKHRARQGALMGCVDTGALIFAEAGLLRSRPAAVHFEALRSYREKFGADMFADRLFDVSDTRCSSAGGVATFDMTLGLIEHFSGRQLAYRVAEILTYRPTNHTGPQQRLLTDTSLARLDRNLAKAVDLMIATLDQPITVAEIAARVGVPQWTLGRLFKHHLQQTPAAYYRNLRLAEARNLVQNSSLRISEISSLCGFENPESFARAYRQRYGHPASRDRQS
ncbi:helix-turn-helix domain-containing protein [Aliisedimentitalea scapharcae]|uniref:Helix-turn-helix domain-containing protein n=1 Tax=Aliisedimentitalea scapharcae TaxID=1524259 RepID=A0ABZ2XX22_9RHOB